MIEYRALTPADLEQLQALRAALWPDEVLDTPSDKYFSGESNVHFGAFDADLMAGFVEGAIREWGDGCDTSPVGWIEGIYVEPAHRRTGIGKRLTELVAEWTRAKGLKELGSDLILGNERSYAAHLGWGFEETERVIMMRRWLA